MPTAVREERFPTSVAYGLVAGPSFMTERVVTGSGYVKKNARWSAPLRKFKVDTALLTETQAAAVAAFIQAVGFGMLYNFRVKDWTDYQATAAFVSGTVDGSNRVFQLAKKYTSGSYVLTRTINKISADVTPIIYDNGSPVSASNYEIDMNTGVLTFNVGQAPASGHTVTWTGVFDVPCEFDDDYLPATYQAFGQMNFLSIGMTEVRL
jgi:uncharacterized protein (TIGR02217 family)